MHFLTFSSWNIYNTLIVLFWVMLNIYIKSYNIGRGVSYSNTIKTALKSVFMLFSVVAIGNLFVDYYTFSIKSILFSVFVFSISILFFRVLTHFILDSYRSYGGNIKNSDHHTDKDAGLFISRIEWNSKNATFDRDEIYKEF